MRTWILVVAMLAMATAYGQDRRAAATKPGTHAAQASARASTGRVLALTVKQAVLQALHSNPNVGIARLDVAKAFAGVDSARSPYDLEAFAGVGGGRNRDPSFNAAIPGTSVTFSGLPAGLVVNPYDSLSWNAGLRTLTMIGTAVEARYDYSRRTTESSYSLDPTIQPSVSVSVSQPLLQGFGLDVNKAAITVAALGGEATAATMARTVASLAYEVEQAYWTYLAAIENRKVGTQALETATSFLKNKLHELEAGTAIQLDVLQARVQVAKRKEELIRARNDADNAGDNLLRLLLPPGALSAWDVQVVLLDTPRVSQKTYDVGATIAYAFQNRGDMRAAALSERATEPTLVAARDQLWPQLALVGTWTNLGLGNSHHNGHEPLVDGDYYNWTVGLELEVPLFQYAAKGAIADAEASMRKAKLTRAALEQTVVYEVRTAIRDVVAGRERMAASKVAVDLAEQQLKEAEAKRTVGVFTNFDVLQMVEALVEAKQVDVQARVDYVLSRARLELASGRMLQRFDITLDQLQQPN